MRNLRTTLQRLGAVVLGVAIAVILGEAAVRLLHLYSDSRFVAPHPFYGTYNIPGAEGWYVKGEVRQYVTINDQGLRDRDHWSAGRGILLLGDSFVAAFQVPLEATCQELAEGLLSRAVDAPIEVTAAACNGWGTANQLAFLRQEGISYDPGAVILALFPENDLFDNLAPVANDCPWPPLSHHGALLKLPGFIRQRLGTSQTLRGVIDRAPLLSGLFIRPAVIRAERATIRGFLHLWHRTPTPLQARMWARLTELLTEMRAWTVAHDADFAVLVVPGRLSLYPHETADFIRDNPGLRDADLDPTILRPRIQALLDSLRIPSLDLLPSFREMAAAGIDPLFPREGHWTEGGNEKAAEGLCRLICERTRIRPGAGAF